MSIAPCDELAGWGGRMNSTRTVVATFFSSSTEAWGAEESLLLLASRLPLFGVEPELCTSNPQLADRWNDVVGSAASIFVPRASSRIRRAAEWARRVKGGIGAVGVVFNMDIAPLALVRKLAIGHRCPLVLDLHDYLPSRRGRRRLWLASRAYDAIVAISAFSASQIGHHPNLTVIHRPVDQSASPYVRHVNGRASRVGVVGRLDPDKAIELAVEAVSLLPGSVELVVKGEASAAHRGYASGLIRLAVARLGSRVRFTGRVDQRRVMEDLDVLIVTNPREALGRTVLEAQLSGVPVVVPDTGGAKELVQDGRTGFVFTAGEPVSLMSAIERALAADVEILEEARDGAEANASPDRYAERYAEILRQVAYAGG